MLKKMSIKPHTMYGVMLTTIDTDYDNPDIEKCKKLVLDDFSSKLLTLFKENPMGMKKHKKPHCFIYSAIDDRWRKRYDFSSRTEDKRICLLSNTVDGIAEHVRDYISDYMEHNYIGRNVTVPTEYDIVNWCGYGEFPFLIIHLIKTSSMDKDSQPYIIYELAR